MRQRLLLLSMACVVLTCAAGAHAVVKRADVVLALKFDEGEGLEALDSSAAENHATLTELVDFGKGKFGPSSLELELPEHAEVPIADNLRLHDTDFTLAMWGAFTDPPPASGLMGHDEGLGDGENKWVWQWFGGRFVFHINRGGNNTAWVRSDFWEDPIVDQWYHFALTRTGITYEFWVDGESIGTDDEEMKLPSDAHEEPIRIGATESAHYAWTGLIDEVVIARNAWSQDDIKKVMSSGIDVGVWSVDPRGRLASTWGTLKTSR